MSQKQCMGTTKKGARCLIKISRGDFCHYHVPYQKKTQTRLGTRPHHFSLSFEDSTVSSPLPASSKSKTDMKLSSKNLTTAAIPHNKRLELQNPVTHSNRRMSPIKYNNINRPFDHSTLARQIPVDYDAIRSSPKYRHSPKVELAALPGYIYVYTLSSFLSKHAEGGWVQTRNLSSQKRHQDKWVDVDMRRLETLLVKVGMTTKTPAIRILQWESKCNHELQCLYPGSHPHLGYSTLSKMLGKLSLKEKSIAKDYLAYVEHHRGFFVPRNILHCEQLIHEILKQKFGRGEIHCKGCHEKAADTEIKRLSILNIFGKKEESAAKTDYNIHNEWFPVPRKSLNEVFAVINSQCMKYKP